MQRGIVYKQWYAPVKETKTKILNVRHLIYIATRPGTVYNPGSTFGLWGKLRQCNSDISQNITGTIEDLQTAVDRVRVISNENKTIYRAIFSIDNRTAKKEGYYNRENWQKLITEHISVLAKEKNMDINDNSFEWTASYHNEKGHPHCHIMFWDNSDKVRNEFVSKEQFEIMSEDVRANLNRIIYHDEITSMFKTSDNVKSEIANILNQNLSNFDKSLLLDNSDLQESESAHALLCGAMLEVNEAEHFNNKISTDYLNDVSDKLNDVIASLPKTGSIDYMYLQPHVKELIDSFTDKILSNNDFSKLKNRYLSLNKQISWQYGNSDESIKFNVDKAQKKLYNSLGNSVIKFIKDNNLLSMGNEKLDAMLEENKSNFLKNSFEFFENSKEYKELLEKFSSSRLSMKKAMDKDLWDLLNKTVKASINSIDVKQNLNVVISILDKLTEDKSITVKQCESIFEYKKKFKSKNTEITQNDINKFFTFAIKNDFSKQISNQILEKLKTEKGWYDFSNKISSITSLEELTPIQDDVKDKLINSIADVFKNDILLSAQINNIADKLPLFTHRYKVFYETDEMKALIDETVKYITDIDSINSLGFDFIDCEMRKNILSKDADANDEDIEDILKKSAFFEFYKEINKAVVDECASRKGWAEIKQQELSLKLMTNIFAVFSQSVGQLDNRSKINPKTLISKDKSKEQLKEIAIKLQSSGMDWDEER